MIVFWVVSAEQGGPIPVQGQSRTDDFVFFESNRLAMAASEDPGQGPLPLWRIKANREELVTNPENDTQTY